MNPLKLFKRKRKLPSGRRLWRADPSVRRMVKQIDAYSSDRAKTGAAVRFIAGRQRIARNILKMAFGAAFGAAVIVNLFLGFLYLLPVDLLAKASPQAAAELSSLRQSGCTDSYARKMILGPLTSLLISNPEHEWLNVLMLERQFQDCAVAHMDFPA